MKHLFILDPYEKLNLALDSSLRLALALLSQGEEVYGCESSALSWQSSAPCAQGSVYKISFKHGSVSEPQKTPVDLPMLLNEFTAIHVRKDPPFDMDYVAMTWLLDSVGRKTKVYNSPEGLRCVNEKTSILRYPKAIKPALLSYSAKEIFEFVKTKAQGDAILKPLTLYGGKGIARISADLGQIEGVMRASGQPYLVQAFDQGIYEGEVRAFCVAGKPLAWCLKKPAAGQFMANSNFNSTRHVYTPTAKILKTVTELAQDLLKKGIFVVGFDLIDEHISEINVTSPRLLTAPEDKTDYYATFARWLREDLAAFSSS